MISIFQIITMEGWVDIMYMIDDTSGGFMTVPYFCLIIIIGSFFLLNLILAVIMRVFTQNDELEKLKFKKRKILEETRKLRNNPKAYLEPLKVVKVTRPRSASYRKQFQNLEAEVEHGGEDSLKKVQPKTALKQSNSNFFPFQSPKKLRTVVEDQKKAVIRIRGASVEKEDNDNVLNLFERKPSSLQRSEELNKSFSLKTRPKERQLSETKVTDIQDRFTLYMSGIKKNPVRHRSSLGAGKMHGQSRLLNQDEKDKLFDKILNLKSSFTSEQISEFKEEEEESHNSMSKAEVKSAELEVRTNQNIFLKIALSKRFNLFIMGSILVNTILLC